jgi:hypothetical protein
MSRNEERAYGNNANVPPTPQQPQVAQPPEMPAPPVPAAANSLNFVVPTEMVDLPSKGEFYANGHPLHGVDSIEVKHMTAKEEDILTSSSLLKKGIALEKMLESIIVNKRIKIADLLIGDKNALLVASRVFGYGALYPTKASCPNCNATTSINFDLNEIQNKELVPMESIVRTDNNTFVVVLSKSGFSVEFRLLTSRDEDIMLDDKKTGTMKLLKLITVSINEQTDRFYIERALQSVPILDASTLKKAYVAVMPDVDLTQDATCSECGETSNMGVPLNADFFWPNI